MPTRAGQRIAQSVEHRNKRKLSSNPGGRVRLPQCWSRVVGFWCVGGVWFSSLPCHGRHLTGSNPVRTAMLAVAQWLEQPVVVRQKRVQSSSVNPNRCRNQVGNPLINGS